MRCYSQLGQDQWVLQNVPHKGYFVDIGASDGVLFSNTYALERMGWTGICAEPHNRFFEELKRNRRCNLSNLCVLNETGLEVDFCEAGCLSGVSSYFSDDHQRTCETIKKKTISLKDLLVNFNAPKHIEYLSLDTENSEWAILKAFNFDYKFKCITVEHNGVKENKEGIAALLKEHNYKRIEKWHTFEEVEKNIEDWYLYELPLL